MTAHLKNISLLAWEKFRGSLLSCPVFFNLGPWKLAKQQQSFYLLTQRWHKLLLFL